MKKLLIAVMVMALMLGALASCQLFGKSGNDGVPISEQAPGAYQPLGAGNVGTVVSGTWNATSITWFYNAARNSYQQGLLISDETGTGSMVWSNSPTLATATLTAPTITTPAITTPTITGSTSMYAITSGTWNGSSVAFTYLQLSRGSIDFPIGNVTASVTHTLGTTPTQIFLTWNGAAPSWTVATGTIWWSLPTASGFTVNLTMALANRPSIAWMAMP